MFIFLTSSMETRADLGFITGELSLISITFTVILMKVRSLGFPKSEADMFSTYCEAVS